MRAEGHYIKGFGEDIGCVFVAPDLVDGDALAVEEVMQRADAYAVVFTHMSHLLTPPLTKIQVRGIVVSRERDRHWSAEDVLPDRLKWLEASDNEICSCDELGLWRADARRPLKPARPVQKGRRARSVQEDAESGR